MNESRETSAYFCKGNFDEVWERKKGGIGGGRVRLSPEFGSLKLSGREMS